MKLINNKNNKLIQIINTLFHRIFAIKTTFYKIAFTHGNKLRIQNNSPIVSEVIAELKQITIKNA